jgi:hypothetical protein
MKVPMRSIKNILKKRLLFFPKLGFRKTDAAILLLADSWGIGRIAAAAAKRGYNVISEIPAYKIKRYPEDSFFSMGASIDNKILNAIASEDLSEIYSERLDYFIKTICPNIEWGVRYYLDMFKKNKVKFVMTPHKSKFEDFPIMAAAKSAKDTISIQFDHGYSIFDLNYWQFTEQPCDLYFAVTDELKRYHIDTVFEKTNTEIKVAETWTGKYRNINRAGTIRGGRKKLLYVPTMMTGSLNRIDGATYPDAWYFKHQMKLLDYFHSESEFDFICKYIPKSDNVFNPIAKVIKEKGWNNVIYAEDDLYRHIKTADFAMFDYPSTPFLEAVLAGVPAVGFYYEGFRVRNSVKNFFGRMLQPFLTTDDVIEKTRNFLRGAPGDYTRVIPEGEEDVFKIIEESADMILESKQARGE